MTLIRLPNPPVKIASSDLNFSSTSSPSAKLTININAFNGNKTNFGRK
jgi:hypothetical protein